MKIAITGSGGIIGKVLVNGLTEYEVTPLDLPEHDIRDYDKLRKLIGGHDIVIHLAWNTKTENIHSQEPDPDNTLMFSNVYRAALEAKVSRVIMASSVHTDNYKLAKPRKKLIPYTLPSPTTPYGAHKVFMESLGRYYANKNLEVICLRFGNVNRKNKPLKEDRTVWLSHHDCIELVKTCIDAKSVPKGYSIIYAVSDSKARVHDYSNPLHWKPVNNADKN